MATVAEQLAAIRGALVALEARVVALEGDGTDRPAMKSDVQAAAAAIDATIATERSDRLAHQAKAEKAVANLANARQALADALADERDRRRVQIEEARQALADLKIKIAVTDEDVAGKLKRARHGARAQHSPSEQPERQARGSSPLVAERTIRVRVGNRTVVRAARPR